MAWSPSVEKLTRMNNKPTFSREVKLQWAGSRETVSTPVEAELFFLTSLFIELIDPDRSPILDECGQRGHLPQEGGYQFSACTG
jgi:hypothetical protein